MTEWFSEGVTGMPAMQPFLQAIVAFALLGVVVVLLRIECAMFAVRGKRRAWWQVRLAALPIACVAAAAVWWPAQATDGPEGLAVFYGLLLTVAPALWFGLHLFAGRSTLPRLSRGESLWLASSALAMLLGPALVLSMLQGPLFSLGRTLERHARDALDERAPPLLAGPVLRWDLGDGDALLGRTLRIPPAVTLLRIEVWQALPGQPDGLWTDAATQVHPWMCRGDDALHLAWPAGSAAPVLRAVWQDARGGRWRGALPAPDAGVDAAPPLRWLADAAVLPLAVSRDTVRRGRRHEARHLWIPLPAARTLAELDACAQRIPLDGEDMDAVQIVIVRGDGPRVHAFERTPRKAGGPD